MAETASNRNELGPKLTPGQRATRFAVGVLFYLILLIPRVRRLRRRVQLWAAIRIVAGLAGLGAAWLFHSRGDWKFMAAALLLMGFALVVGATPVKKSLDERARELGAMAVLNGGTIAISPAATEQKVNLFAGPEILVVENAAGTTLLEIPMAQIRSCRAQTSEPGEGKPWNLEITWGEGAPQTTRFHFEGFFAEHLARVAESAIESLRKTRLPVLP
jgi:hypothetical protein